MAAIQTLLKYIDVGMVGAEIGVQSAASSKLILEELVWKLYCIDPWKRTEGYTEFCGDGDFAAWKAMAMKILHPYEDAEKAVIMEMGSLAAAVKIPDNSLDFVFLDGNHSYEFVIADCVVWWNKIKEGGFLSGHDYTFNKPPTHDVKRALDWWSHVMNKTVTQLGECWIVRKDESSNNCP